MTAVSSAAAGPSSIACGTSSTTVTLKLPWIGSPSLSVAWTVTPVSVIAVLQQAVGVLERLRQRRRVGVGHIARAGTRSRALQMNADNLGRSRTTVPTRSPMPSSANVTLWPSCVCSWPSSAAVSTSTIESRRLAGTSLPKLTTAVPLCRQQTRAGGLVSPRRQRVIGRNGNPSSSTVRLVVDTTLGTESAASVDRQRRGRGVAVLVGDRVVEGIAAPPNPP